MYLTPFRVSQFNTSFTFTFSILISSSLIITSKNPTFLISHLHFFSSNNPSKVVNTTFHLFPFFIHILLQSHLKFNFVNTFLIFMFSTISKIKSKGQLFLMVHSFKYLVLNHSLLTILFSHKNFKSLIYSSQLFFNELIHLFFLFS